MFDKNAIIASICAIVAFGAGATLTMMVPTVSNDPTAMQKSYAAQRLVTAGILTSRHSLKGEEGKQALVKAIQDGETELARTLLWLGILPENTPAASPLCIAADLNHTDLVSTLLQYGANPNIHDHKEKTPLLLATKNANKEAIAALLEAGANPQLSDSEGHQPLMYAAQAGDTEIIHMLVNAGADTNATDHNQHSALNYAIEANQPFSLQTLIQRGANINRKNTQGRTPLMSAAEGHPECLLILLTSGANLQATDDWGETALDHARYHQSKACIHLLESAEKQAAIDQLDRRGVKPRAFNSALLEASYIGDDTVIKLLIAAGADLNAQDTNGTTPLMQATRHRQQSTTLRLLLSAGADPASVDNQGFAAFNYAVSNSNIEALGLLLDNTDPQLLKGSAGASALLDSAMKGNRKIFELLIGAGATPNAKLHHLPIIAYAAGATSELHADKRAVKLLLQAGADTSQLAAVGTWATPSCLPLLLAAGADPQEGLASVVSTGNIKNLRTMLSYGAQPTDEAVFVAVKKRQRLCLSHLIQAGANINCRDKNGRSPLMWAVNGSAYSCHTQGISDDFFPMSQEGDTATTALLLCAGADVDLRDNSGTTASMVAAYQGHPHCLQLLIAAGADINIANNEGDTPLSLAVKKGRIHCINLLVSAHKDTTKPPYSQTEE